MSLSAIIVTKFETGLSARLVSAGNWLLMRLPRQREGKTMNTQANNIKEYPYFISSYFTKKDEEENIIPNGETLVSLSAKGNATVKDSKGKNHKLGIRETNALFCLGDLISGIKEHGNTCKRYFVLERKKITMCGSNYTLYEGNTPISQSATGGGYDKRAKALAESLCFLFPYDSKYFYEILQTSGRRVDNVISTLEALGFTINYTVGRNEDHITLSASPNHKF